MKKKLFCLLVSASMIAYTNKTETKNLDPLSGTFVSRDEKAKTSLNDMKLFSTGDYSFVDKI